MIYFRDYHWLTVQGYTQFEALIDTDNRKPEDVFWSLNLRALSGGPEWRRVEYYKRPSLWLQISSFKPKLRNWTDLEHLDFWKAEEDEDAAGFAPSGLLDVDFHPEAGSKTHESSFITDALWRVAAREAGCFTVELAAFTNSQSLLDALGLGAVKVTPEGEEVKPEPGPEFWQERAELYLLENIPFGTVTVRAPRNVRDPEGYALHRAQELIGVPPPEHIVVRDFLASNRRHGSECSERIQQDYFVELHFHGYYED